MKGLLMFAAVMLIALVFLPAKADAQNCVNGSCQQRGSIAGTWSPSVRMTPAPIAQILPWNWNARVVRYVVRPRYNPARNQRQGQGGSAQYYQPGDKTPAVNIPKPSTRTVRYILR